MVATICLVQARSYQSEIHIFSADRTSCTAASLTSADLSCHQTYNCTEGEGQRDSPHSWLRIKVCQVKRIKYLMVVVLCVVKNSASLFSLCWGRGWLGSHVDLTLHC